MDGSGEFRRDGPVCDSRGRGLLFESRQGCEDPRILRFFVGDEDKGAARLWGLELECGEERFAEGAGEGAAFEVC